MEQDFYRGRLESHELQVLVPDEPDRTTVHEIIYTELVRGRIEPASKQHYLEIIGRLLDRGAEGVIAGCTEIELLVGPDDVPCPFFPTTRLHALAAVDAALAG
jgi:aspartate racemase